MQTNLLKCSCLLNYKENKLERSDYKFVLLKYTINCNESLIIAFKDKSVFYQEK